MDTFRNLLGEKPLKKLILILSSLFIAILSISIIFIIINQPKVNISFPDGTNIPDSELVKIRKVLYGVIKDNSDNFDDKITYEGIAREYQEYSNTSEKTTATFIVDFDSIKQSYFITINWPADKDDDIPNYIIDCPLEKSKYTETKCHTESSSNTNISSFLPHIDKLKSGQEYTIAYKYNNTVPYIEIQVNSCGNSNILDDALASSKEWIKKINLNPDDYQFYLPSNLCDNEAHEEINNIKTEYYTVSSLKTTDENVNKNLPYFIPNLYNIYPITDNEGNVVSIKAELSGCTDYQTEPMEEQVKDYLNTKNINYPLSFDYCK